MSFGSVNINEWQVSNMKEEKYISVNMLPKHMNIMLVISMFIGCFLVSPSLDGDFYFLYSFGRYISNHGFPVKDVLSMHGDMNIIVQQWLTDVLFYHVYELFGNIGVIAIVYAVLVIYVVLFYKLCKLVTDNFFLSVITTTFSAILLSILFMVTRPQIFTYVFFVILLLCLEKYTRTGKRRYLCVLPVLSLFQINFHASMWLMLFILMMPYVVSCININLLFYKESAVCRWKDLIVTMVGMIMAAFLNPYGHKSLLYLFGSYGVDNINQTILEMQAISISESAGKLYLGLLFLFSFLFMVCKKRKIKLRFLCLGMGTAVLGLTSYKAMVYFYIVGFLAVAHYFRDFDYSLKISEGKRTKKEKIRVAVLVILLIAATGYLIYGETIGKNQEKERKHIEYLKPVVEYLGTQEKENMVLYAGFNEGSFLEFHQYKPYIDGRAELFLEDKNGQFDYFSEYLSVYHGTGYYKEFLDKYGFTHIVVPTEDNYLYISIIHDSDYQVGYSDENYTVFIQADLD